RNVEESPLLVDVFRVRTGILLPSLTWEPFLTHAEDVDVLGRHALRAPERRDLEVARFTSSKRFVGCDLVSEPFYNPPQPLHWLILCFLLLLHQRQDLLAEKLQVEGRAIDAVLVVHFTEPMLGVEEVGYEVRRVLAVPMELRPKIDEPSRPVPDGGASRPARFSARLCSERLDRSFGNRVVGSFQKFEVGASTPLRRTEVFAGD